MEESSRKGPASSAKEICGVLLGLSLQALLQRMKVACISPQDIIRRFTAVSPGQNQSSPGQGQGQKQTEGAGTGVRLGEFRDVVLSMLGSSFSF